MIEGLSRVLVTGATGFVGWALTQRLSAEGHDVVCLVRRGSPNIARVQALPHVTCVETDFSVTQLETLIPTHSPEVIFHLAASGIRPDDRAPEQLVTGHVGLTLALLQACIKRPPRQFVFAGSCSEYAPIATGSLLREDHPLVPTSMYGAAKVSAYLLGRTLAMVHHLPFVSLRLFGIFGPGEGPERLVPHLYAHFASGQTPHLTPGEQARDFTYIDDVVEALLIGAMNSSLEPYRAYNVCSGHPTTVREIATLVAQAAGQKNADIGLGRRPYRSDESMWIVGDPTSFSGETGYAPRISVEEGIVRMVNELRRAGAAS